MKAPTPFPSLLQAFFLDRLIRQQQASPHTITGYRDTFRLLLQYAQRKLRKPPSEITMEVLDVAFLGGFLEHLESERRNSVRTRNLRLAALHSFFHYVSLHAPEYSALAQRVLAIPCKRYARRPIAFLTATEMAALLATPDLATWSGRRDRAILLLALQTGLRASELLGLRCEDVELRRAAHVDAEEKVERSAARRCARIPSQSCGVGCKNDKGDARIRCSPPAVAAPSAMTASPIYSRSI